MPLLDHFHPPMDDEAPWEGVGTLWVSNVVKLLNRSLPRDRCRAIPTIHLGDRADADIAEFELPGGMPHHERNGDGGLATLTAPVAVATFEPEYQDEVSVRIQDLRDNKRLVGAVEFVSPSNKDRDEARQQFIGKCQSYLKAGIGLVVVDVVTTRLANLHNELMALLRGPLHSRLPDVPCYAVGYRGTHDDARKWVATWPFPAAVGQPLPSAPLFLKDGPCVTIDFERTYTEVLTDLNL